MLVSTRIVSTCEGRNVVERDWRVVTIPEEDSLQASIADLFNGIVEHSFDPMEPFSPPPETQSYTVCAQVGQTKAGDFQDVPLNARLSQVTDAFGLHYKFMLIVQLGELAGPLQTVRVDKPRRNAYEVSSSIAAS